jgi:hypothetical protein
MKICNFSLLMLLSLILMGQKSLAQNDLWCVVMKNGSHAEAYEHKPEFPANFISEQWKKKQYVTELTYDGSEWWVVTGAVNYSYQAYYKSRAFPGDWVEKKWNEGFDISNVEYGGGEWVVIMSKGTGYTGGSWGKRGSFAEIQEFIKTKWNDKKDIIDIDKEFIKGVKFHYVKTMQQVLELALS